jgi:hypothetical protein
MQQRKIEKLEHWNSGMMELRNMGHLKGGISEYRRDRKRFHVDFLFLLVQLFSIIPLFQYSIIPDFCFGGRE